MLVSISTTVEPATDLGFVLHKHPDQARTVDLTFGRASVFWPEAAPARATACLLVEVDPVSLVRDRKGPGGDGGSLAQYVNDRPYVASSFVSVALLKLFGTAMGGRSQTRPELAEASWPLEVRLPVVPCRGGDALLRKLFEPLGYAVAAARLPLDDHFPEWGESRYYDVTLSGTVRVAELLQHLYVLLPVLDDDKHYWVNEVEIDKLVRRGGEWLAAHPEHTLITRRFLRHDRRLTRVALERLLEDQTEDPDDVAAARNAEEEVVEERLSLNDQRLAAVVAALRSADARRVLDLGCGEGRLVQRLLADRTFAEVVGVDVS